MTDVTLYQNKKHAETIQFPTEWSELTIKELQFIAGCVYAEKMVPADLFLCIVRERCKNRNLITYIDIEQAAIDGLPLVQFIIEDIALTKNPLPELKGYFGPADDFLDLTCGEFEDAETSFFLLKERKEDLHLNTLIATLWRKKVNGSRVPFTDYKTADHVKVFAQIPFKTRIIIFLWYIGCRELLARQFPEVFSGGGKGDDQIPAAVAFTRCIHMGAGVKNGTRDQIRKMNLKEFLFDIQLELRALAEQAKKD